MFVGIGPLDTSRISSSILLALYVALALAYSLVTPMYEATDEIRHVRYVRHLTVFGELPVQSAEGPRAQSHHPPLYYAAGALASWWVPVGQEVYYEPPRNPHWTDRHDEVSVDNKNQYLVTGAERFRFSGTNLVVYLVRWITIALGAVTVWLTYRLGREVIPDQPALALGGAALVAFNPQFLHLSGSVSNDVPAALWGAAVLLICLRVAQGGSDLRTDATLGVLYGLALLTKLHLVALAVPIALAYVIRALSSRDWRSLARSGMVVLGLTALISGWWFWRNFALYGDPTGMTKVSELWAGRPAQGNWWAIRQGLPYLWSSLWGRFGYGQLPLHQSVYQGILAVCALALAGYVVPRRDTLPVNLLALLGVTVLTFVGVVLYYMLIQPAGAMGRFLFPGLPSLSILIVYGLSRLVPRRRTGQLGVGVSLVAGGVAVYALVAVLGPAFARPRLLPGREIVTVPNRVDAEFGDVVRLLGYSVASDVIEPGGTVEVKLYWQPLARTQRQHAFFVHLLSDVGTMVAQRDSYPGLGRYPTTAWEPSAAFVDTVRIHVPQTAYSPDTGYLQVGFYLPDGPRLMLSHGRDALRLASVEIDAPSGEVPNPQEVDFGREIALVGYELDRRVVQPGDVLQLTLYWRGLVAMEADYRGFAHVLGAENQLWANSNKLLLEDSVPTSEWRGGEVVTDRRPLPIDPATPPGFYDIEVGVHGSDGARLPVIADGGHQLGNRILLSKIRVGDD